MRIALKHKILALTALAAVLPLAVVSVLLLYQKQALVAAVTEDANTKARQDAGQVAEMVYRMCQMCNRRTGRVLEEHLQAAAAELNRLGEVGFHNNQISWDARNQFGGAATGPVKLATMTIGGRTLVPNHDFNVETPLVDVVTRFTSGYCTVFQRMNAQGDMLRIATTVPAADGKRAIGTFLPRRIPNGEENEVLAAVSRGETYVGRAMVLDQWHAAAYEPIWDSTAKKEVVGMLYVGFNLDEVNRELREAIQAIRVGKSGSVFVVQGKGEQRGEHIIAKDAASDRSNMWDIRDATGRPFIQSAINKALQAPQGVPEFERYPWREKDRKTPWMKVTAVTYFAPWDWVIGATTSEDDYSEILANLDAAVGRVLHTGPWGGVVVLLAVLGLALILARAIVNPITEIIGVTKVIAEGNLADANSNLEVLKHRLNGKGTDEPGQLFSAVSLMTKRLCSLVSQMQRSCVSLASTATQIAATSRQQEATVTEFGASTSQVNVAVKEISATSQELAKTMEDVKRVATETEHLADAGRNRLGGMEASMRQLAEATVNISGRLAVINEKAANINSMVTTIAKVADQTNLLSLNASIEAEKAGEYGHGFAVVAREIRRLADQTGVASLEIEHTVREMQSSVAAGVMEVKKFSSEVARGVQGANEISAQIEQIIEQVKVLLPRFETVNVGMRAQAEGAGQISVAMTQLTKGARDAGESIKQFKDATEQLKEAAKGLQVEASRFKV